MYPQIPANGVGWTPELGGNSPAQLAPSFPSITSTPFPGQNFNVNGNPPIVFQPQPALQPPHQQPFLSQFQAQPQPLTQTYAAQTSNPMTQMTLGLTSLANLDRLYIRQHTELLEAVSGLDIPNVYHIFNGQNQQIFVAKEFGNFVTRGGGARPFDISVTDLLGQEVIHLNRPTGCSCCWFPCCLDELKIFSPRGNSVGTVHQQMTFCSRKFLVVNGRGESILQIEQPAFSGGCCGDSEFVITDNFNGAYVGKITRKFNMMAATNLSTADTFELSFPAALALEVKAILIGTTILIDFIYFEQAAIDPNQRRGYGHGPGISGFGHSGPSFTIHT